MTIAVYAAAALLVLAVAWLIAAVVQRQLQGKPIQHREAPHPLAPGQMKPQ